MTLDRSCHVRYFVIICGLFLFLLFCSVIAAIFAMYVSGLGIEALLHLDDDFLYAT